MNKAIHKCKSISVLLALFILASIIFIYFPRLDITVSGWFFDTDSQSFPQRKTLIPMTFYHLIRAFTVATTLWCIGGLLLRKFAPNKTPKRLPSNKLMAFLLITMILAPGFIVHQGFKDNFGRTRPVNIIEFGGNQEYSSAYEFSENGGKSFISGHAAMGFFACAYAFLFTGFMRCKVYIGGLIFGTTCASMRIIQGGHFLSDVVLAALITLIVIHVYNWLWLKDKD
jgi:lipid A 4'-phosphatase